MDEKILIKKDGYLNIQKSESDVRVSVNITVEPVCYNEQKFKPGDKVRIKDGISSKTHFFVEPSFTNRMNEFIGRKLTVNGYVPGYRYVNISESVYNFHEDWLEPADELKVGDWVIAWDTVDNIVISRLILTSKQDNDPRPYYVCDKWFKHAVKWDKTFEHIEKIRKENEARRS